MERHDDVNAPRQRSGLIALPWRTFAVRLLLELLVVFAGVYMASAFAKYQQERVDRARRHQIRQALIAEIRDITSNTRRAAKDLRSGLMEYDTLIKLKRNPPLEPYLEPVRFQSHIWESTLQSGGLELFDPLTMYKMSEFYNDLNDGFEQLEQMRRLSESMLLPVLGAEGGEFYETATGKLRPKYRWYFSTMRELSGIAQRITERGDSLVAQLCQDDGGCSAQKTAGK